MLMARLGTLCNRPFKSHRVHQKEDHRQLIFPSGHLSKCSTGITLLLCLGSSAAVSGRERERSQWINVISAVTGSKKNVKCMYLRKLMDVDRDSGYVVLYP
jgi:hypothetical protein